MLLYLENDQSTRDTCTQYEVYDFCQRPKFFFFFAYILKS